MGYKHLVDCGHEKIAFASTPLNRWTRKKKYLKATNRQWKRLVLNITTITFLLHRTKIENEEEGYEVEAGRQMGKKFIQNKLDATAVMMVNDMMAFGFIQELNKQGVSVPGDVSVMGFDDIPFASLFSPALTTICYPSLETGKLAAKMLFERMNGDSDFVLNVRLEPKLVVRNSVKEI